MFTREEKIERRCRAWLVLVVGLCGLGALVGLAVGCETATLDRAQLYLGAFDAADIDVTPPPEDAGAEDASADDAAPDASDSSSDASDASATDTGTDTGQDAADAAGG